MACITPLSSVHSPRAAQHHQSAFFWNSLKKADPNSDWDQIMDAYEEADDEINVDYAPNINEKSILFLAAEAGQFELVRMMMCKQPNADFTTSYGGKSIPYFLAKLGNSYLLTHVITRKQEVDYMEVYPLAVNNNLWIPVSHIHQCSKLFAIDSYDQNDPDGQYTPLYHAACYRQFSIIKEMLICKPEANLNTHHKGKSPLDRLVPAPESLEKNEVLDMLIFLGADVPLSCTHIRKKQVDAVLEIQKGGKLIDEKGVQAFIFSYPHFVKFSMTTLRSGMVRCLQ